MLVQPDTFYEVVYRNCDGIMRGHVYFNLHHAEQFARALQCAKGITEIQIETRRNRKARATKTKLFD
jgi:hypothetical protein